MFGGLRRAHEMRGHHHDHGEHDPDGPAGKGEQRQRTRGRSRGGQPPELTAQQRSGLGAGDLRRQPKAGRDGKRGKPGQAPKQPFAPADLATADGQPGN